MQGKRLPANTLATTPHQCTAIDSCWEKLLQLQNDKKEENKIKYKKKRQIITTFLGVMKIR